MRSKEGAVGRGQLDFNDNAHEFFLAKVIEPGLLRTVVADMTIGELRKLGESDAGRVCSKRFRS